MTTDMLVKLYDLPDEIPELEELKKEGIEIKRAMPMDKHLITQFIKDTFYEGWASECEASFTNKPISCFIAVKDRKVIGFACYDATARDYFGPTGVSKSLRGKGIGKALLLKSLLAMREDGYAYAVIGWVDTAVEFYRKTVNAIVIEDSFPGVYQGMVAPPHKDLKD